MEPVIVAILAVAFTAGVLFAVYTVREKIINKKVLEHSLRIQDLLVLNREIQFHDISNAFLVCKHYDNKSNYNKIEPAYLMSGDLRANISYYSEYALKMKENREKAVLYKEKIKELAQRAYAVNYPDLKLSEKTYLHHEKKLFQEKMISPVTDCTFCVTMTYSSPKGQVNLSKEAIFRFDDMVVSLESVSRSRLDRETYSRLAAVERGAVSDSLRYDVMNRDHFACVICGASSKQGARLHVDHIIPIAKGGKSVPENLRTLCERCNIGKSNKIEGALPQQQNSVADNLQKCDWCGAGLVLRKGKYGAFYGCANYPRCRFTKNAEE